VDETWVSTDNANIKKISKKYGCNIIDRPPEISIDNSRSEEALIHFAENYIFDIIVFIQPTSPLLLSNDIDGGLKLISNFDSVFSAYKEHWYPRWRNKKNPQTINWEISDRPMRQEKKYKYVENGAFYITTRESLLNTGLRYSGKIGLYEMPLSRSFQIDQHDDLTIVEAIINRK
tara:strand:+ start:1349 stop:1873 length:525 start_codon:yes stop_codon:yes gene_type:complete